MIDPATEYTLALALEDLVPVAFGFLGLWLVAARVAVRSEAAGRLAALGAVLVGLGGLAKAGWKIVVVTTGTAVPVLEGALFPLIGAGFAFVLTAWVALRRDDREPRPGIPLAVVVTATVLAMVLATTAGGDTWSLPFLLLAVVGSVALALLLAADARRRGDLPTASLFVLYVVGMFVMARLSAIELQTLQLQWIEQSISTVSQGAFLLAAHRSRHAAVTTSAGATPAVAERVATR